jgi:hypothetical protein
MIVRKYCKRKGAGELVLGKFLAAAVVAIALFETPVLACF